VKYKYLAEEQLPWVTARGYPAQDPISPSIPGPAVAHSRLPEKGVRRGQV